MAGKDQLEWPSTEELLEKAKGHASYRQLANSLGYATSTLKDHVRREGLSARLQAEFEKTRTVKAKKPPDVFTSGGRREHRQDADLRHLRKENRKLRESLVNQEELVERIVSVASELRPAPSFEVRPSAAKPGTRKRDVILPMFDLQFGTRVRPTDAPGGMNTFDSAIFSGRLERYVEAVAGSMRDYAASHTLDNIIFCLGGDMVEGYGIFKGQEWQLDLDPVEQVIQLRPLLEEAIVTLTGLAVEELGAANASVFCVPGNHGRVDRGALPSTASWDYLLFRWLESSLANFPFGNFVIEPAGSLFFESQGHTFLMVHGDEVRGWGSLPYYGLTRFDAQATRLHNGIFDYLLLGHHHRPANISIGYGEHLMSGNWVGATQLSRQIVAGGRPSQWVFYVSEEWGVGERSMIHLQKREETPRGPRIHRPTSPAERSRSVVHT